MKKRHYSRVYLILYYIKHNIFHRLINCNICTLFFIIIVFFISLQLQFDIPVFLFEIERVSHETRYNRAFAISFRTNLIRLGSGLLRSSSHSFETSTIPSTRCSYKFTALHFFTTLLSSRVN